MTVVAIVGVMAALAISGYDHATRGARRSASAREIQMVLMEARSEARARNQPVRIDVTPAVRSGTAGSLVRWGRLPCADGYGRTCPSAACGAATQCSTAALPGPCVCARLGEEIFIPTLIDGAPVFTGLNGLCFLGSSGGPRGTSCAAASAVVPSVRIDLPGQTQPVLIILERLTGSSRIVDCGMMPRDPDCP